MRVVKHASVGAVMLSICAAASNVPATTPCHTSFEFLGGFAPGEIWIGEHVGLEPYDHCMGGNITRIWLRDSVSVATIEFDLDDGDWTPKADSAWTWIRQATSHFRTVPVETLSVRDGAFVDTTHSISISRPEPDRALGNQFERDVPEQGQEWHAWVRERGVLRLPVSDIGSLELIYADPEGLYLNYSIKAAYHLPAWRALVVLTETGAQASYETTMHGFLILRLEE